MLQLVVAGSLLQGLQDQKRMKLKNLCLDAFGDDSGVLQRRQTSCHNKYPPQSNCTRREIEHLLLLLRLNADLEMRGRMDTLQLRLQWVVTARGKRKGAPGVLKM